MLDVDYKHDQYEHDSEDEHTEALVKHISERIYAPTGDEGPYESEASVYGELASQSQAQAIQARSSSVVDVYGKPASQSQARAIQARIQVVEHECTVVAESCWIAARSSDQTVGPPDLLCRQDQAE